MTAAFLLLRVEPLHALTAEAALRCDIARARAQLRRLESRAFSGVAERATKLADIAALEAVADELWRAAGGELEGAGATPIVGEVERMALWPR